MAEWAKLKRNITHTLRKGEVERGEGCGVADAAVLRACLWGGPGWAGLVWSVMMIMRAVCTLAVAQVVQVRN